MTIVIGAYGAPTVAIRTDGTQTPDSLLSIHVDTQSGCFCSDEAYCALQTREECRAAEAKLVLVRLRWRTHEGEEGLGLPMSQKEEKEFAMHARRGAGDGKQERDSVIVSVSVAVLCVWLQGFI